jgi:ankyrin repeat protein
VNAKKKGGATPLRLAIRKNNKEVTKLLRQHGAQESDA